LAATFLCRRHFKYASIFAAFVSAEEENALVIVRLNKHLARVLGLTQLFDWTAFSP